MKISYIIPVYNAEKCIEKCVRSIIDCYHCPFEYEIFLIDDGSCDESGVICDRLSHENSAVFAVHTENGGVSKARNLGLKLVNGDWIRFIDSDDMVSSGWLEDIKKNRVVSDWLIMNAEVRNEKEKLVRTVDAKYNTVSSPRDALHDMDEMGKMTTLHYLWNHLYRTAIIQKNELMFDEDVDLGEDFLFNCAYMKCCDIVEYRSSLCYIYYKRNGIGLTSRFHVDELERRRKMDNELMSLYRYFDCYDECKAMLSKMIGGISIGALESAASKVGSDSFLLRMNFLDKFYNSEYYEYMIEYIRQTKKPGNSELVEYKLIMHRSKLVFYWFIRLRDKWRNK